MPHPLHLGFFFSLELLEVNWAKMTLSALQIMLLDISSLVQSHVTTTWQTLDKNSSCLTPSLIMYISGNHRIIIGQSYQNLSCQCWELRKCNQSTNAKRTVLLWVYSCTKGPIRQRERKIYRGSLLALTVVTHPPHPTPAPHEGHTYGSFSWRWQVGYFL